MIAGDQKKSFDFLLELVLGNGKKEDRTAGHQPLGVPASHFPQAVPRGPSAPPAPAQRFFSRSSVGTFSAFLQPEHLGLRYQPRLSRFRYRWPSDQQDLPSLKHCFLGNVVLRLPSFFDCSRKTTLPSMPSKRKADPGGQLHVTTHYGFTVLWPAFWWPCVIWYLSVAG